MAGKRKTFRRTVDILMAATAAGWGGRGMLAGVVEKTKKKKDRLCPSFFFLAPPRIVRSTIRTGLGTQSPPLGLKRIGSAWGCGGLWPPQI